MADSERMMLTICLLLLALVISMPVGIGLGCKRIGRWWRSRRLRRRFQPVYRRLRVRTR